MPSAPKYQEEEDQPVIQVKTGWLTKSYRGLMLALLSGGVSYMVLWADRHNDDRYVSKAEYAKDQVHLREINDMHNAEVERQLRDQSASLKEIKDDVKTLVQSMMKGPTRL